MGSTAALQALQPGRGACGGIHLTDDSTGESNLPFLRRQLKTSAYEVITFATWEEGLVVRSGNPKQIRSVADLVRDDVTVINREEGAGARLLLDQTAACGGLGRFAGKGYDRTAASHLHVARLVAEGQADAVWNQIRRTMLRPRIHFAFSRRVTIWWSRKRISPVILL